MPRKGRRRRRKLAPPPEHEGKLHNKPHKAKGRPMLPFTFVRQTRRKLRLLARPSFLRDVFEETCRTLAPPATATLAVRRCESRLLDATSLAARGRCDFISSFFTKKALDEVIELDELNEVDELNELDELNEIGERNLKCF